MIIHYVWNEGCETYSEYSDETFCDSVEYDYEVSFEKFKEAITKIFAEHFKIPQEIAYKIIFNFDLYDACEVEYEEQLKDYFEQEAYNQYKCK